jgi:DNA-binding response OmpR family regulator
MQKVLQRIFREQGYVVIVCGDGQAGLDAFRSGRPSAVMLDLMLPGIFGRDLCKIMKAEQPGVPVIVVSAISEVADKVLLLELGADDYVTKPFSPRELMAGAGGPSQAAEASSRGDYNLCSFGECESILPR